MGPFIIQSINLSLSFQPLDIIPGYYSSVYPVILREDFDARSNFMPDCVPIIILILLIYVGL